MEEEFQIGCQLSVDGCWLEKSLDCTRDDYGNGFSWGIVALSELFLRRCSAWKSECEKPDPCGHALTSNMNKGIVKILLFDEIMMTQCDFILFDNRLRDA